MRNLVDEKEIPMADKPVFLFLGVYGNPVEARADLELVRRLHADGVIGTYDAGVAVKEVDGTVIVDKWEKPTQHGAWTGIAVGAVVGILFPPSIIGAAAVAGLGGGLIGHFWKGMSRKDVHELGEALDAGEALLIVVGRDKLDGALRKAGIRAQRQVEKQIDMEGKDLDGQLAAAQKQITAT
jgi:uncharacterized membrane protein